MTLNAYHIKLRKICYKYIYVHRYIYMHIYMHTYTFVCVCVCVRVCVCVCMYVGCHLLFMTVHVAQNQLVWILQTVFSNAAGLRRGEYFFLYVLRFVNPLLWERIRGVYLLFEKKKRSCSFIRICGFCITGRALPRIFVWYMISVPWLSYTPTVGVSVTMSASVFVHRSDCHRNNLLAPFNDFTSVCESFVTLVS